MAIGKSPYLVGPSGQEAKKGIPQKKKAQKLPPSLQSCLLAETDSPTITVYRRRSDSFEREILSGLETTLDLPEADLSIPFALLYQDISFSS